MDTTPTHSQPPVLSKLAQLLDVLRGVSRADVFSVATLALPFVARFLDRHHGIYEVQDCRMQLELRDARGKSAVLEKRLQVRFAQNNVIAYQDQAWGDGDIFHTYSCRPGFPVDTYRDGHRFRVLISLRETKNRGDREEFRIHRTIQNGFVRDTEDFQIEIEHPTRQLELTILFPHSRPPQSVKLVEQNAGRTILLAGDSVQQLPDGRHEFRWKSWDLRPNEAYIIRWEW